MYMPVHVLSQPVPGRHRKVAPTWSACDLAAYLWVRWQTATGFAGTSPLGNTDRDASRILWRKRSCVIRIK